MRSRTWRNPRSLLRHSSACQTDPLILEELGIEYEDQQDRPEDRTKPTRCERRHHDEAHVSVITLGVRDLNRAKKFYSEGLGWPIQQAQGPWVCFSLGDGSSALGLFPWEALAGDAGVAADGSGFRGITLSYVVCSEARVDAVLAEAERAGGKIAKPAQRAQWGGYFGYFADPDGYLWKAAVGAGFAAE